MQWLRSCNVFLRNEKIDRRGQKKLPVEGYEKTSRGELHKHSCLCEKTFLPHNFDLAAWDSSNSGSNASIDSNSLGTVVPFSVAARILSFDHQSILAASSIARNDDSSSSFSNSLLPAIGQSARTLEGLQARDG